MDVFTVVVGVVCAVTGIVSSVVGLYTCFCKDAGACRQSCCRCICYCRRQAIDDPPVPSVEMIQLPKARPGETWV